MGRDDIVADVDNTYTLFLNHPCKELIWITKTPYNQQTDFADLVSSASLDLNGEPRFSEQDGNYFNSVQPYQHHSASPKKGIYLYSFSISPEKHQPSGTCNFSRIDSSELKITGTSALSNSNYVYIYAKNYNILRIMSGMGGVAFSN